MRCPKCGERPLTLTRFLSTINPLRIQCGNCGAQLRAGWFAYLWTVLHLPLVIGLVELDRMLLRHGLLSGQLTQGGYVIAALALLFVTSFVIPWYGFNRVYHLSFR